MAREIKIKTGMSTEELMNVSGTLEEKAGWYFIIAYYNGAFSTAVRQGPYDTRDEAEAASNEKLAEYGKKKYVCQKPYIWEIKASAYHFLP